uniref:Rad21/Rec8-like protein C-terminal eukaryotic domain-containing protein n=1 Tax=Oreochromis niloticus TaxID=8128 RepID=I3KB41_ORENI
MIKDRTTYAEEQTEESSWKGAMSSADQLEEAVLGTDRDSVWLLDEETGQPMAVPLATIALEMTPVQVAMPSPPSGASGKEGDRTTERPCDEVAAPPLRKRGGRRRRQLVFADPQVQISERVMEEQIGNPRAETLRLSDVLLDFLSVTTHATPAQLFSTPCGSLLHTDLQTLWKRQASLAVLPRQEKEKGEEEEEEEERLGLEQEREIMRAERKRRHSSMKEIPSVSRLQSTEGSSVSDMMLDMSKEDRSVSDAVTPISRWSLQEEVQQPMEPIAEERIEMPEAQTDVDSRDMLSWITFGLQRFGEVTFDSLLPPEASRSTATDTFYKLLELLSAGQVTVHQTEPYSCITISSAKLTMAA